MRQENHHWDAIRTSYERISAGAGVISLTPTVAIQRLSDGNWLANGGGSWAAGYAVNTMSETDSTNLPGRYHYSIPSGRLTYAQGLLGYLVRIIDLSLPTEETVLIYALRSEWDELRASHVVSSSFGSGVIVSSLLADVITAASIAMDAIAASEIATTAVDEIVAAITIPTPPTASAIADAVWDESKTGHVTTGTMGHLVQVIAGMCLANHRLKDPTFDSEGRMLTATMVAYPTGADALSETNALATFSGTWTYDVDGNVSTTLVRE